MIRHRELPLCALVVGAVLTASSALAGAGDDPKARARAHFESGVDLYRNGDAVHAAEEFQAAYRELPHYSTLSNLGQAYASIGRPVEAAAALRGYLKEADPRTDGDKPALVRRLLEGQEASIGFLEVAAPAGAEVMVDGRAVGHAPMNDAIPLASGPHGLWVTLGGRLPHAESIAIEPRRTTRVSVALAEPGRAGALIRAECPVPGVQVTVDGSRIAGAATRVDAGTHRVRFERPGYLPSTVVVDVAADSVAFGVCRMVPDSMHPALLGTLRVTGAPDEASITVDGEQVATITHLPFGRHRVEVAHGGFHRWTRNIDVKRGSEIKMRVELIPTPRHLRELDERNRRKQVIGMGLTAGGALLLAAAGGVFLWNDSRYDSWRADRSAAYREYAASPTPGGLARISSVEGGPAGIQGVDDLALGLAVVGVGAVAAGLVTWLGGGERAVVSREEHRGR